MSNCVVLLLDRDDPLRRDQRVIWLTSMPMPPGPRESRFRNEFTGQAADSLLIPHLRRLGVEIFHILPIVRPRVKDSNGDNLHYSLGAGRDDETPVDQLEGQVGSEISRLISRMICPKV